MARQLATPANTQAKANSAHQRDRRKRGGKARLRVIGSAPG